MLQEIAVDRDGNVVKISEVTSALRSWTDRADFADRGWTCPVCGGPMSVKFGNKGSVERGRETHFFHSVPYPGSDHEPESVRHKDTKDFLVRSLSESLSSELAAGRISAFDGPRTEEILCGGDSRADVYFSVTRTDGSERRYAVEVQYSPMSPEEFARRHGNYFADGVTDCWIFWPDFMKPTKTGKLRPAAAIEPVFRVFWHATVVSEGGFVDYFPPPPERKRVFEPGSREFLYAWNPEIPEGFSFAAKKPVDMSKYTVAEFVTRTYGYFRTDDVLFSVSAGPTAAFSESEGIASAYGEAAEASASLAEAYEKEYEKRRKEDEKYEREERERLESVAAFAASEAQAYPILAFGILAAFMERTFAEFYRNRRFFSESVRKFHMPFDTDKEGRKIRFAKTSDALMHVLRRLAYVRGAGDNAAAWECLDMDAYVRAYASCFWKYAHETSAAFSSFPATAQEVEREGRIVCCADYGDDYGDEAREKNAGFRYVSDLLEGWGGHWDEAGQLFSRTGFEPVFRKLVGNGWEKAVLSFVRHPDSRAAAAEHVRNVAQLFAWIQEYDPDTFLVLERDSGSDPLPDGGFF